ncbi:MAG TPA: hypothetical protein VFA70_09875 [Dehalococcoidia bacterium]|nr:hypothetical protein [Dehalococcoidia bacterium]
MVAQGPQPHALIPTHPAAAGDGRRLVVALSLVLALWLAVLLALGGLVALFGRGDRFNIAGWELTHLADELVKHTMTAPFQRAASPADLRQFFALEAEATSLRARLITQPDATAQIQLDADERRIAGLRLRVELRFEQAIGDAARQAGLTTSVPLFGSAGLLWPPVAVALVQPPHILIVSPRTRIALESTTLLQSDLSRAQAARIERTAEERPNTSALVDQIGGLGSYPSIDDESDSPLDLIQTTAHEWVHEYLAFHPLGARYAQSDDMTLINETVANLVGRELGSAAFAELGLPLPAPAQPRAGAIDFDRTLHTLRLEVDQLLAQGRVDEAEQRMNETAALLRANGYAIRRINQAYFAFYGSYGDTAASSNPLGGEIVSLRRLSPSLAAFVRSVQGIAQPADLRRLLRQVGGAQAGAP